MTGGSTHIWMNGDLVPYEDAKVHVLTHALHYGTGVFEGVRAYETERGTAVFRHEDVRTVLRTPSVFSSHRGATQIRDPLPADLAYVQRMMLNQDPPEHSRLRRMLTRAFTPRAVARLEDRIRSNAREIVRSLSGDFAQRMAALEAAGRRATKGFPQPGGRHPGQLPGGGRAPRLRGSSGALRPAACSPERLQTGCSGGPGSAVRRAPDGAWRVCKDGPDATPPS